MFSPFMIKISDVDNDQNISSTVWKKISNAYSEEKHQVNLKRSQRITVIDL